MQADAAAIAPRSATTRSRVTNDPRHIPGVDGRKQSERRRRDLIVILIDALGGADVVSELQLVAVRKAAELITAAESERARVLGGASDIGGLVRLEGEARRALRELGIKPHAKAPVSLRDQLAAEAGEAA